MEEIILLTEEKMEKDIENMEKRFINVRAGRANPSMLDGITVPYYGVETPLRQLATLSVPEARMLVIKPFDRSCIGAIEKAIFDANIGLTPNNNGETVILNIPALTEERRREFVKQVKTISEEAKIAIRNIRQESNKQIEKLELAEDIEKSGLNEIQELVNKYNKKIEDLLKVKEDELMNI